MLGFPHIMNNVNPAFLMEVKISLLPAPMYTLKCLMALEKS